MKNIANILKAGVLFPEDIPTVFYEIAGNGQTCILKSDGNRDTRLITAIISFPDNPLKTIRNDGNDLCQVLFSCLVECAKEEH